MAPYHRATVAFMRSPRLLLTLLCLPAFAVAQDATYFPPRGEWEQRAPGRVGLDSDALDAAVLAAMDAEASTAIDLRAYIASTLANEPHGEIEKQRADMLMAAGELRFEEAVKLRDRLNELEAIELSR